MKAVINLTILIFSAILLSISACNKTSKENTKNYVQTTDSLYDLNIHGCKQKILVQTNNTDKPILLYLHGGPGSSVMMYSHLYSARLKENFILVNWDMRGAALSYHEGMDTKKVSQEQIASDALYLIHYLMEKYHKKKIYLLGHSFGSVLGMYLIDNYPELFHAYIGVGQVINYNESVPIIYEWLHDTLLKTGDSEALNRIEGDKFPYIDLVVKYGGHHRLSINLDSVIRKSPYYFDGYLDLLQKGKQFSAANVGKNPKVFKHPSEIKELKLPLYFFEGRNDHVIACAPELVVNYCKTVTAPVKKIIWFENSAHYINVEEPEKFQDELIKILYENK